MQHVCSNTQHSIMYAANIYIGFKNRNFQYMFHGYLRNLENKFLDVG